MDIWIIYRQTKNADNHQVEKIQPIEYCPNETDARKYARLFDLQVPIDRKDYVSHKTYHVFAQETMP